MNVAVGIESFYLRLCDEVDGYEFFVARHQRQISDVFFLAIRVDWNRLRRDERAEVTWKMRGEIIFVRKRFQPANLLCNPEPTATWYRNSAPIGTANITLRDGRGWEI